MTDLTARAPVRSGPMPFMMLLDEAMRRTRRHFRAIFPAVAIPFALLAAVTGVLQALWFQSLTSEAGRLTRPPVWSVETILLGLLQGVVVGIGMVALQKAAVDATAGRPVDMKEAWRFAVRGPVLGTLFLQFLAVLASALACFFPVLYVAPLLSLVMVVMVEEKIFGTDALSRSAELTRYNPQGGFVESPIVKALILMLVTVVISALTAMLVALPFQIPMFISLFRDTTAGKDPAMAMESMSKWIWLQIPAQILQMMTRAAVYLYSAFGYALLFFDTRSRKEGSDLAAEIRTVFGATPAQGEPLP